MRHSQASSQVSETLTCTHFLGWHLAAQRPKWGGNEGVQPGEPVQRHGFTPGSHPPPDSIWAHLQRQLSLSAPRVLKLVPWRTRLLWRPAEPLYPLRESLEATLRW